MGYASLQGKRTIDVLTWATNILQGENIISPRLNAESLLSLATGKSRVELYANFDRPLAREEWERFVPLLSRRLAHEPLQYITGKRGFRFLELEVGPAAMIPRPETELLVERALAKMKAAGLKCTVLDLGTGAGCIGLSVAQENPEAVVHASDISPEALELARRNAKANGLEGRVHFHPSDLFSALPLELQGGIDYLLANPPYISAREYQGLPPEVKEYEPRIALLAGDDGTYFHRKILKEAREWLSPGGWIILEGGAHQMEELKESAAAQGYREVEILYDYAGLPRFLEAQNRQAL
jgi:release factor glutamine methyltransferase